MREEAGDDQFTHERLDVWQRSVDFATEIYRVTNTFPAEERFALTNQLRRAAVSVSSNIAEGNARMSSRDKMRFLEIAYGSLMEVVSQLEIAGRLGYVVPSSLHGPRGTARAIARQLSALRQAIERRSQ